jgi:hypothetical protein
MGWQGIEVKCEASKKSDTTICSIPGTDDEAEASARLIAAAPDLFAALGLALEYWEHRQKRYANRHPRWVVDARAAIAKTRGESH